MTFSVDVKKFADQAKVSIAEAKQYAALKIFAAVVYATPVGNPSIWLYKHPTRGYIDYLSFKDPPAGYVGGRLRGNWQASIGSPITTQIERIDKVGDAVNEAISKIVNVSFGDETIWLTNNLPYAMRVEEGWSTQAPTGMVRVSILGWEDAVKEAAAR